MHPALPTLSLIISNDFLIFDHGMSVFLLHSLTHALIFLRSFRLIFQFKSPTICGLLVMRSLFIYSFFFISAQRHSSPSSIGLHGEVSFSSPSFSHRLPASMVVKTQPLCTPLAKRRIRRIMAMTEFHHWSVVYHSCSKSLLTQFGYVNCKMSCQTMLDRKERVD